MLTFLRKLFSKSKPEPLEKAPLVQDNEGGVRPLESPTNALANEEAENFPVDTAFNDIVSSMFDRRNDPLSSAPQGNYDFVALDVETASRDPSTICQIGLACVAGSNVETFVTLINPECPVDDRNYAVHMIEDAELSGKPCFPDVVEILRPLLESHLVIQHSDFDRKALQGACERYNIPPVKTKWGDSMNAAKHAWPELKTSGGYGLRNVAIALGIDFDHHDAGEDARACAETVLKAMAATGMPLVDITSRPPSRREPSYPPVVSRDANPDGPLCGHCAVFTGSLTIARTEAADLAAKAGIRVVTSVSKKVTLLVVGDQDLTLLAGHDKSSKHRKAEDLIASGQSIRIIGEAEFLSLVSMGKAAPKDGQLQ